MKDEDELVAGRGMVDIANAMREQYERKGLSRPSRPSSRPSGRGLDDIADSDTPRSRGRSGGLDLSDLVQKGDREREEPSRTSQRMRPSIGRQMEDKPSNEENAIEMALKRELDRVTKDSIESEALIVDEGIVLTEELEEPKELPIPKEMDLEAELKAVTCDVTKIDNMPFTNLNDVVSDFKNYTRSIKLNEAKMEMTIPKELPDYKNGAVMLQYSLKLKVDSDSLDKVYKETLNKVEEDFNRTRTALSTRKKDIEDMLVNAPKEDIREVKKEVHRQKEDMSSKVTQVERYIERELEVSNQKVSATAIKDSRVLLDTKAKIMGMKKRIDKTLGEGYEIGKKTNYIRTPSNEKELRDIVKKAEESMKHLDFKERSFYSSKIFEVLYYPTRSASANLHVLVSVINTLILVLLAFKFIQFISIAFAMLIGLEILNQINIAKQVKKASYAIEFTDKAENLFEEYRQRKNEMGRDKNTVERTKRLTPFYNKMTNLTERLEVKADDKVGLIENHFDFESSLEEVHECYEYALEKLKESRETNLILVETQKSNLEISLNDNIKHLMDSYNAVKDPHFLDIDNLMSQRMLAKFIVGHLEGALGVKLNIKLPFPQGSYLIEATSDLDKKEKLNKVKMLVAQALNLMKPGKLKVNFIDIENVGNDFIELLSKNDTVSEILTESEAIEKLIEGSTREVKNRMQVIMKRHDGIESYNAEKIENKAVTMGYVINIVYNYNEDLLKSGKLTPILTQGGQCGYTTILFTTPKMYPKPDDEEGIRDLTEKLKAFDFSVKQKGDVVKFKSVSRKIALEDTPFENVKGMKAVPTVYSYSRLKEVIDRVDKTAEDNKLDSLNYDVLQSKIMPDGYFKENTVDGIEMYLGFTDGDLTKPHKVKFGDKPVHGLMIGGTGSGKSNIVNVGLLSLFQRYSPEWLQIVGVDFKNVEFNFYTEEVEGKYYTKRETVIPHAQVLAGTTDGEYAVSLMNYVLTEMEKRKKLLAKTYEFGDFKTSFKNVKEYNKAVLEHNAKDRYPIIPRLLFVIDELKVLFSLDDDELVELTRTNVGRLSREARTMGIHMFFISQGMSDTFNEETKDQFLLRIAGMSSAEESKNTLGNDGASKITMGYAISNESQAHEAKDNKLIRVPFIPESHLKEEVLKIRDLAKDNNTLNSAMPFYNVSYFDETKPHFDIEGQAWYKHKNIREHEDRFVLGPKTIVSQGEVPQMMNLRKDDNENVVVLGNNSRDTANIMYTLMHNAYNKPNAEVIVLNFDNLLTEFIDTSVIMEDALPMLENKKLTDNGLNILRSLIHTDEEWENFASDFCKYASMQLNGNYSDDGDYDDDLDEPIEVVDIGFDFNYNSDDEEEEEEVEEEVEEDEDYDEGDEEEEEQSYDELLGIRRIPKEEGKRYYVFLVGLHKDRDIGSYDIADSNTILMELLKLGPSRGVHIISNFRSPFNYAGKIRDLSNHGISAKISADTSDELFNNKKASKLFETPEMAIAYYKDFGKLTESKFKIFTKYPREEIVTEEEVIEIQ